MPHANLILPLRDSPGERQENHAKSQPEMSKCRPLLELGNPRILFWGLAPTSGRFL